MAIALALVVLGAWGGWPSQAETVRFRTIGDITCTGAVRSEAATLDEIIAEVSASRITDRGSRADDRRSDAAKEDRKKQVDF